MRRLITAAGLLVGLALPVGAQTTGVCGVNDLTLNGFLSGSTSCTPLIVAGVPLTMTTTSGPGALGTIFTINLCPCTPCLLGRAPAPGPPPCVAPIPFTACGGITNQSLDIVGGPPCQPTALTFFVPAAPGGPPCPTGIAPATSSTITFPPLPPGFALSTQAFILETTCFSPSWILTLFPFPLAILKTQAYDFFT